MSKIKEKLREFGLSSLAVDNRTSIFILTFMIMLFGIQSYNSMPKEQFPEVSFPTIFVNTPYFGNSATDIENLVTRPIEKELQGVEKVKDIKSTSIQDFSVITVEFESGADITEATRKVKDAVDKAKSELPSDLTKDPEVLDIDLSEIPIVTVNVSGNYNNDELFNYAEFLKEKIETLDEVSEVDLRGDQEREVKVDVDLLKMEARQVNFGDIANAIGTENMTMSGGELLSNNMRRAIRVKGEFTDIDQLKNVIVKSEFQNPIYLRDIADVTFGYKDRTSIARSDGNPVISLNVIKRKGGNLLEASDKIKELVEEAKTQIPDDVIISLFNDQSINTRNQVNNLENSILSGIILVTLVLLFFLGLRNASFVGIAIPLSMLTGILWLSLTGVTMNIVVLFSLILALGLLVDNAIVVVENIYRYMQEGYSAIESSKYGAGEVAVPIIASTATTLAAFLPLAFWPGIMGEFMKYLPITLILVLASSLFVALVINPVFTSVFMKVDEKRETAQERKRANRNVLIFAGVLFLISVIGLLANVIWLRNLFGLASAVTLINYFVLRPGAFWFQNKALPVLETGYDHFIRWALHYPKTVFMGTVLTLVVAVSLMMIKTPPTEFFPTADPLYINMFVDLPLGSDIEATNKVMRELEKDVEEVLQPYDHIVEAVLSQIGENTSDPSSPPEPGASPQRARLTINFVKVEDRGGISTFDVMEEIRDKVKGYPGVQIVVDKNSDGPSAGKPINLEIQGEEIDQLLNETEKIVNFINNKNIPGIEELKRDVQIGKPELIVTVNRDAARRYGVSTYAVADALRTSVFGAEVSKFKQGEDEYDIMVRLSDEYRNNVDNLMNQRITFRDMATGKIAQVPISAVANAEYSSTYSSIKRKNLDRVVTIYSNVTTDYNANEINAELKELMQDYALPEGMTYEFTGEQQQQAEDMGYLFSAFLVAVFLIFIILVAQFNSITAPFIIILSVVFSVIGVLLGYIIFQNTFSVIFSSVGIIALAGVVVNNAIVLIDYTNLLVKRAREKTNVDSLYKMKGKNVKEAIILGGATRLRPVLLTAITTVLGLVPLAIGFNFNFFTLITDTDPQIFFGGDNTAIWGPMAKTVIYGLVFATFLTLIVVPVMYWLFYRLNLKVLRLTGFQKRPVATADEATE